MAECTITPHDYRLRDRAGPRNRHDAWACKWCQKRIEVEPGVNPNKQADGPVQFSDQYKEF